MFPIRDIIFLDIFELSMDKSHKPISDMVKSSLACPGAWSHSGCARGKTGSPATLDKYCDMFRWSSEFTITPLDRESVACHSGLWAACGGVLFRFTSNCLGDSKTECINVEPVKTQYRGCFRKIPNQKHARAWPIG